ncbi:hypothetical protein [Paenarthrobacter sp. NCHU4564]|uniref:hypothetical protein n=1 Tax=Paenarthrobacter sp. NCHU4564 TaxID=3451353 RepID=UPI003F95D5B5
MSVRVALQQVEQWLVLVIELCRDTDARLIIPAWQVTERAGAGGLAPQQHHSGCFPKGIQSHETHLRHAGGGDRCGPFGLHGSRYAAAYREPECNVDGGTDVDPHGFDGISNRHTRTDSYVDRQPQSDGQRGADADSVTNHDADADSVTNHDADADSVTNHNADADSVTNHDADADSVTNHDADTNAHHASGPG